MILCCGEALIDMIPSINRSGEAGFTPHAGGAVFNTAIGLGRLGIQTGFVSGLSTDLFGEQLKNALDASNVDTSCSVYSERPTTLAFVKLVDGHATYSFYDENTAGRMLSAADKPTTPDAVQAMYFGGISLISEPCADFYADLAAANSDDRVIVVDPNIRIGFIKDEARYRKRLDRIIAVADIVKVSDEDLDWILPGDATIEAKAEALCAQGPCLVILTRGSKGASAVMADGTWVDVASRKVEVVDTVGAGDTFNSGFLAALSATGKLAKPVLGQLTSEDVKAALSMGAKVAAITVSRAGANPPWAHELKDDADAN